MEKWRKRKVQSLSMRKASKISSKKALFYKISYPFRFTNIIGLPWHMDTMNEHRNSSISDHMVCIGMSTIVSTTNECIFVVSRDRNRSLTRILIILKIVRASEETFIFLRRYVNWVSKESSRYLELSALYHPVDKYPSKYIKKNSSPFFFPNFYFDRWMIYISWRT